MHDFTKLEKAIGKDLEELGENGSVSSGSIDLIHKLTDTYKNLLKIEYLCKQKEEGEYSQRGFYRDGSYRYMRGGAYGDGSYADEADYSERRRDSMGRFARGGEEDHMIAEMGDLMRRARTEKERKAIEAGLRMLRE